MIKFERYRKLIGIDYKSPKRYFNDSDEVDYLENELFLVNEKIHGANFAIYFYKTNNEKIEYKFAKRGSFLGKESNFFNHKKRLNEETIRPFENLAKEIMDEYNFRNIILCGEIFGGSGKFVKPIQQGIYYSDYIEFLIFDVATQNDRGKLEYLSFNKIYSKYNKRYSKMFIPVEFVGTYEDAVKYITDNIEESSRIPEFLHGSWINDNIAKGYDGNIKEGYVIRSLDRPEIGYKFKTEKWFEIRKKHAHKFEYDIEEFNVIVKDIKENLLNENRVYSAVSKIGDDVFVKELIEEIFNDIIEDLNTSVDFSIHKQESKNIRKLISQFVFRMRSNKLISFKLEGEQYND